MTPENIATCKAILTALAAEPMPGATAGIASDGALDVTFNDVSFTLRRGEWVGNAVSITCRLRDYQIERASAVHKEIARIGAMMAIAADKPNPAHRADLFKIGNAIGHKGAMIADAIADTAARVKREEQGALQAWGRVFDLNIRLGLGQTAKHEEAIAMIANLRQADPLGMLGAPSAYSNGEALTMKERLLYLLARVAE